MSTVVMAIDGEAKPGDVLPTYHSMVRKPEHVILVHVRTPLRETSQGSAPGNAPEDASDRILRTYRQALEDSGSVRVTALVREGVLSEELIRIADDRRADLIIVGDGRPSGPLRLLRGRSTAELERRSTVPVIVAPRSTHPQSAAHNLNGREHHAS